MTYIAGCTLDVDVILRYHANTTTADAWEEICHNAARDAVERDRMELDGLVATIRSDARLGCKIPEINGAAWIGPSTKPKEAPDAK